MYVCMYVCICIFTYIYIHMFIIICIYMLYIYYIIYICLYFILFYFHFYLYYSIYIFLVLIDNNLLHCFLSTKVECVCFFICFILLFRVLPPGLAMLYRWHRTIFCRLLNICNYSGFFVHQSLYIFIFCFKFFCYFISILH